MYKLLLICAALIIIGGVSCKKEDTKSAGKAAVNTASNPQQVSEDPVMVEDVLPRDGGEVTLESWQEQQDEEFPPLTDEQMAEIRQKLIEYAPEFGFSYDESIDTMSGEGMPAEGLELAVLIDAVSWQARRERLEWEKIGFDKLCMGIYMELQPKPEEARKPPKESGRDNSGTGRIRSGSDGDSGAADSSGDQKSPADGRIFAASAIGEWKSVREDSPRITTYHNEEYFDFLQVFHDGTAFYKVFRKQQMERYFEFTYTYQPRTGTLKLINDKGEVGLQWTLKMDRGNEELLFAQKDNDDSVLVMEKIGTGMPPPPDPSGIGPGAGGSG